ncbi:MAG: ATP cone domain-containing protein [Proteobacteria bacterium]|nr:ATP cone domain-containing protein [Pseudomonadota bacterium]
MQCPYCRAESSVTETRVTADGLRRRRMCTACKRRFTTYEKVGLPGLKVTKRDGTVELFDREKIVEALARVTAHRTVTDDDLRRIAADIEGRLVDGARKVVAWSDIAQLAIDRLRDIDPVSANRLAANYTDETGALRLVHDKATDRPQLGLRLEDDD